MNKIPQNCSRRFTNRCNDDLVRRAIALKLAESGFNEGQPVDQDIINRLMQPLGSHRLKDFVAAFRTANEGV